MLASLILHLYTFADLARRRPSRGAGRFAIATVAGPALIAIIACSNSRAWSATLTWNNTATSTNWSTASNWGGTVPGSGDAGLFSAVSYTSQPSLSSTAAIGGLWDIGAGSVTIGGTNALTLFGTTINSNTGTGIEIDTSAGSFTVNAPLVLQNNQQWLNNSAGTFAVNGNISGSGSLTLLGSGLLALTGTNTYSGVTTVDGGTLQMSSGSLASPTQYVGYLASGSFMQSGGTNAASNSVNLGYKAGSSGTYTLTGGSLWTPNEYIGNSGSGNFTLSAGTNTVSGNLFVGSGTGSIGSYALSGGWLGAASEYVGYSGSGSVTQSGGTNSLSSELDLATNGIASSGAYTLSFSGVLTAPYEYIGDSGRGSFTQSGGTNTVSNYLFLGLSSTASRGAYTLAGGRLSAAIQYIGDTGSGSFTQTGGTNSISSNMYLAYNGTASSGSYTLGGSGLVTAANAYLGYAGSGSFMQSGGTSTISSNLYLGYSGTGSSGSYILSGTGAPALSAGNEYIGYAGTGNFTQSSGSNSTGGVILGQNANSSGTYNLNGGLLSLSSLNQGSGSAAFTFGGGTMQATHSFTISLPIPLTSAGSNDVFNTGGNMLTLAGPLSGPGGLQGAGAGTLVLSVSNGYTGTSLVSGGTLLLANSAALWGSTFDTSGSGSLSFGTLSTATFGGLQGSGNLSLNNASAAAVSLSVGRDNASTTLSGVLSGGGSLTKVGSGILDLCGSNTYTGVTTAATSELLLDFSQPAAPKANIVNSVANSSSLILAGGTLAIQGNATLSNSQRFNGLTVNPGASAVLPTASNPLLLSLGSITRSGAGGTIDFTLPGGTQSAANGITTTTPNNTTGILGAYATVAGADWASSTAGNITAYSAYTIGDVGQMASNSALNVMPFGAQSAVASSTVFNTLNLTGTEGVAMTGSGSLTLAGGGLIGNTSGTISGGTLEGSSGTAGNGELIVVTPQNLTIASAIADNGGPTALTKSGSATLTLSAADSFTGTTLVVEGTLLLANTAALIGGTFDTSGAGSVSFGALTNAVFGGLQGSGNLSLNNASPAAVSLTVGGDNASTTFSGGLSGSGSLTKLGSGMLTLTGLNTYNGSTTVDGGTLQFSSGGLASPTQYVGYSATGSFTQAGGINAPSVNLYVGYNVGSSGTYSLSGGGLFAGTETIASSGNGSFTQSGGTHSTASYLYVGSNAGSSGAYILSGGSLVCGNNEYIGYSGSGSFTQSGGTNTLPSNAYNILYLGYNSGGKGTYSLSGGGVLSWPNEYLGGDISLSSGGTGSFTQSGGTNSVSDNFRLGICPGGSGSYNLTGGLLNAYYETIGYASSGSFTQSGGTNSVYQMYLTGPVATYNLGSSAVLAASYAEFVGDLGSGTASFTQTAGSNSATSYLWVGGGEYYRSGEGVYSLTGGSLSSAYEGVGYNAIGIFTQSGGINTAGYLVLGQQQGSGSYTLSGGSLYASSAEDIGGTSGLYGNFGTGYFTQSGGTNSTYEVALGDFGGCFGTFTLSGGSLYATVEIVGSGGFAQSGGTNSVNPQGYLEVGAFGPGTYSLTGSGLLSAPVEYIGYLAFTGASTNSAIFTQSGGTNAVSSQLYLGYETGGGTYNLAGSGLLTAPSEFVGFAAPSYFTQSGGTNAVSLSLTVGCSGSSGTYSLSGSGLLTSPDEYIGTVLTLGQSGGTGSFIQSGGTNSAPYQYIGYSGTGSFTQSGGSNFATSLTLGYSGGAGTYSLSGSGLLSATFEQMQTSASLFQQTGGTNTATLINASGGHYLLSGGLLEINAGLETAGGTLDFGGGTATIQATNSIVDLTGSIGNTASTSLVAGPNSLVIVASASSASAFGVFSNGGLTHVLGTTLNVSAGTGFGGWGTITDPVACQGTISATPSGQINLTNGLSLSGTGRVNLRSGVLTVNDLVSGVSGPGATSLTAAALTVASSGAGSFAQSGGSVTLSDLYVGYGAGSSGAYSLSGSGRLSVPYEYIGYYGSGSFTQSGGTNAVSGGLVLGEYAGSAGTYNLNAGLLSLSFGGLTQGAGSASFNFGGGTLGATIPWTSSMILNLTGSGGASTVDTTGGNIGLSGNLIGSGTLNKAGPGVLSLGGTNSAVSALIVSQGTLQFVSGSLTANSEYAGYSGLGVIRQTGGTNSVSNAVYLGPNGTYDLSGGLLLAPSIQGPTGTLSVSGGTLTVQSVAVSTAVRRHLTIEASTISGAITGTGSVTSSGSGTTFISGVNPFSGAWTVSQGSLELANANALQNATLVVNVDGGLLFYPNIGTFNVGGLAGSGSFTLNDTNQNPLTLVLGGNNADTTYGGNLDGLGGVMKEGRGKTTLLGKNTFKGGFGIDPGIVSINADAALGDPTGSTTWNNLTANVIFQADSTLQADASFALAANRTIAISASTTATFDNQGYTFTIGGPIGGPGGLATAGSGTLVLCSSNTYTGATNVAIGTLKLDFSQSGAPPANIVNNQTDSSSLVLGGGVLAMQGNANTSNSQQFNGLAVNPGSSAIVLANSGASNPLLLSLGSISRSPGGTVDFTLPGGTQSANNGITTSTPSINGILGGYATVSGANWAASTGTDGYITAYTAYTGGNLGSLATNATLNISPSGAQTAVTTADAFYTLNLTGSEGVTMSGTGALALAGGGLIGNTSGAISGGSLAGSSGTAAELIVITPQNLTIGSVIVNNSGATALTKAGAATLILTGNNTYSGATTIGAGTLQIGSGGATGTLGSGPVINDAALVFNLSGTPGFGGSISGSGALTKMGSGTLVLSGSNSFSGGTAISQGALQLANPAALLDTTVAININSGLQFSPGIGTFYLGGLAGGNTLKLADTAGGIIGLVVGGNGASTTFGGAISGSGTLTKVGGGDLVFSGSDNYSTTLVSAGSLQVGSGTTGSLTGTITDNATLVFNRSDSPTFGGSISGSGLLVQAGTGILTLSGSSSFGGGTTITAGSLALNNAVALPNSTLTINNNNSLLFNTNFGAITTFNVGALTGSGNIGLAGAGYAATLSAGGNGTSTTYSGALSGAGGLAITGSGVMDLCGSNSYTGLTTVTASQLLLDFTQPGAPKANILNNAANSSALTLAGGTLAIQGSPTLSNSQRFNGLTVSPGASAIVLTASNPLVLSLGYITRSTAGGTIDFTLPAGTQSSTNGITTTTPNNATGILGAYATVGGADWACSTAGNITAYSAYTVGDVGQMASNSALNVELTGFTPQSYLTSAVSFNTLNLTAGYGVTMTGAGALVLAGGGLIGNTYGSISGGTLEGSAGATGELIVNTPQTLVITSVIADNGGHTTLTKTGSAALVLFGSNTYSGATLVNEGMLIAAGANTLSPSSAVAVNNGILDVTSGPQTVSSLAIGSLGTLNLYIGNLLTSTGTASFAAGSTLNISGQIVIPDLLMTYSGLAHGTFSNVSYNGGALPPLDQLSYISGMLEIVNAPTLSASGNWSTGNWSGGKAPNGPGQGAELSTSNTAQLTVTLDVPVTLGALQFGSIGSPNAGWVVAGSGGSGLTFNNSGGTAAVNVLSGTNSITAQVLVAGGNLDIAASNGGILTFSNNVSDDGGQRSLTLDGDGSGQLILGGSNSYSGGTNVNAGVLVVNHVAALLDESSLTVGPGAEANFDSPVEAPAAGVRIEAAGTVAEPGTLALLVAGCLLAVIRRQREGARSRAEGARRSVRT
jgi:fibronectin-binding autotransporter adhesin